MGTVKDGRPRVRRVETKAGVGVPTVGELSPAGTTVTWHPTHDPFC
jgi:hypothetical protein